MNQNKKYMNIFDYKKIVNKAMNCCILTCIILPAVFLGTAFGDVENELEVYPEVLTKITLPYKYKHLSKKEIEKAVLLSKRLYATLELGGKAKIIIMYPLDPCIGIGLYYKGRAVLGHLHFSSNLNGFIDKAKRAVHK